MGKVNFIFEPLGLGSVLGQVSNFLECPDSSIIVSRHSVEDRRKQVQFPYAGSLSELPKFYKVFGQKLYYELWIK